MHLKNESKGRFDFRHELVISGKQLVVLFVKIKKY